MTKLLSEQKIRSIIEHDGIVITLPLPLNILKQIMEKGFYKITDEEGEFIIESPKLDSHQAHMYRVFIKMAEEGHPLIKVNIP